MKYPKNGQIKIDDRNFLWEWDQEDGSVEVYPQSNGCSVFAIDFEIGVPQKDAERVAMAIAKRWIRTER